MKRGIGVFLAIVMVLSLVTACNNGIETTTAGDSSMTQGQDGSSSSDAGASAGQGTTAPKSSTEGMTSTQEAWMTQNPNLSLYPNAGVPLDGDKKGFKSAEWIAVFGEEKLAKASDSGIVYTLGGYQDQIGTYADVRDRKHEGADWFAIPQLNADTPDAKSFNANMQALANGVVESHKSMLASGYITTLDGINYVVYEHGDYVSIIVLYYTSQHPAGAEESAVAVVYDKKQGRFLSWKEIMGATGTKNADLTGFYKWFAVGDLYSAQASESAGTSDWIRKNFVEDTQYGSFFLWSRMYSTGMEDELGAPDEVNIRATLYDTIFQALYYPHASLYINDAGELSIVGRHVNVARNVAESHNNDVAQFRIQATTVKAAMEEINAFALLDDPMSELYQAIAKKAGVDPKDGPDAYVIRLGVAVSALSTNVEFAEDEKSELMLQGVQDLLKETYPEGNIAEHIRTSILLPLSSNTAVKYPFYLVVLKDKWNILSTTGDYNVISSTALGSAVFPMGGYNKTIEIRKNGEIIGSIASKEDGVLDFEGASSFVDVTDLIKPNSNVDADVKYILQDYSPLAIPEF